MDRRCKIEGSALVKSEVKSFEAFRRDQQVRETVLWSETLEKATKQPPKPKCAGCGERWPCSDSKRTDIKGGERAKHFIQQPPKGQSEVKKALPAPDPQGPKIPKPPVAGAPIAAERKAKFGNKTSATAPTAAPTPKPPSMPTKATTKAPKVPAAPKPAGAPKAPNQSSGSR